MALLALATAFIAQYGFDLYPCLLCVWQRWAYGLVILLAVLALVMRGVWRSWISRLTGIAFLGVSGVALFHVGVEQGWWKGSEACSGADIANATDLKAAILSGPTTSCTDIPWELGGISIAGFNVIFTLIFAAITLKLAGKDKWR